MRCRFNYRRWCKDQMIRIIPGFFLLFLMNIQVVTAQTTCTGSEKVFITWLRIEAEKEKKSKVNLKICGPGDVSVCDFNKSIFPTVVVLPPKAETGDVSIMRIRDRTGTWAETTEDDFSIDLYPENSGDKSAFNYSNTHMATDAQSALINGAAALVGSIIEKAFGTSSFTNKRIRLHKAHVHPK
ncbi:MAG: hypothetical protein NTU98_05505 [Bacteroidetes bacterium]|nr:hypothetical protein [Bacteroidota bacterium]